MNKTTSARGDVTGTGVLPTPAEIDLAGLLERRARLSGERPAVTYRGHTATFAEVQDRVLRLAQVLCDGGVGKGDRIAYLGLNHPAILDALFAAAHLGAVLVPLNYRFAGPELTYAIDHSAVHTVLADSAHTAVIDSIRETLPARRYVRVGAGERVAGWEDGDDLVAASSTLPERVPTAPADPALVMYTSGTTGRSKGVVLTHANLWWHNIGVILALDIAHDDVSLVCAPLFHIGALNVTTIATWIKGGRLVIHETFDAAAVLADLEAERVTTMFGVPVMCEAVSALPGFATADLSALRLIITGGAPVPIGLIQRFQARGVDLAQGYGLTEASPVAAFLTAEHAVGKLGSAGRPLLLCDLRVVDPTGAPVPAGVSGEIEVRGPSVTPGYLNDPETTALAFDGEWLRTGDGGHLDDDGFVFIADRIKDMIISGGENIYPAEVEEALFDHPGIAEIAVIGTPDPRWGEGVCAVVVPRPGATLTLEELREHAEKRIGRYKLPRRLEIVDVLPRNATGKILKTELRKVYNTAS
ncbi:AMP-binding enzyme, putative [Streptomyces albus]|uniref:AMP-binding enzyme, putative n=1 Tax=Streptomyces albus (strain ATCC 21838 / DSM 41398 / FERM P-419 / JCM 4703 / NBRC 107858) TaxID=1081613 RepID=A0A0B5EQG9_STRA4|nr:AMP-binding enzyme, putative [Streptomyces albus]AOU78134.1 AMP-binding enzyme, putative [Streptomyces albus]AYN33889.1 AMP-binding enzyme, putative [Streptomyces albus]